MNKGTKNIICLISSYKFTLKMINNAIMDKDEIIKEFIIIKTNEFFLNFFSINKFKNKPNKTIIGNLKNNQMGI